MRRVKNDMLKILAYAAFLSLALMSTGCNGCFFGAYNYGLNFGTSSDESTGRLVPYTRIDSDGQQCVIWSDMDRSVVGTQDASHCSGSHVSSDGRRFDWKCEIKHRGTFTQLVINGKTYELSKGTVFLVASKSGQTAVLQLNADDSKDFGDLAKSDERIRTFFRNYSDYFSEVQRYDPYP